MFGRIATIPGDRDIFSDQYLSDRARERVQTLRQDLEAIELRLDDLYHIKPLPAFMCAYAVEVETLLVQRMYVVQEIKNLKRRSRASTQAKTKIDIDEFQVSDNIALLMKRMEELRALGIIQGKTFGG